MSWTAWGAIWGITLAAIVLAAGLVASWYRERQIRAAYIATLSPDDRERMRGFMRTARCTWREFREFERASGRGA
jgi:hypothetical protein